MKILIPFLLLVVLSCQNAQKFDSQKWKEKGIDWQMDDVRENMADDLIDQDILISQNKSEIFLLLGEPEYEKENRLFYLVREKYKWDIDPEYIKYLVVEVDENGFAVKCFIEST